MNGAVAFGVLSAACVAALLLIFIMRRRMRKPTPIRWMSIAGFSLVAGFVAMILWAVFDRSEVAFFDDLDWEELSQLDDETAPQPQL